MKRLELLQVTQVKIFFSAKKLGWSYLGLYGYAADVVR